MPSQSSISTTTVQVWEGHRRENRDDSLAVEEPLEIRLGGLSVAVTMRTPGHDFDLVRGFLITEGIVRTPQEIASITYCEEPDSAGNIVNVNVRDPKLVDPTRWQRNFYASSSCGICGKASIEAVRVETSDIDADYTVDIETLHSLEGSLLTRQDTFRQTGGLHAAALFDLNGRLATLCEDVGRHNAVDKVIGSMAETDFGALKQSLLMVSGRASFEVVQKALKAGIPIVVAVSAPSSLAVKLAASSGMTLVGFLRKGRCNVYSGMHRIVTGAPEAAPPGSQSLR